MFFADFIELAAKRHQRQQQQLPVTFYMEYVALHQHLGEVSERLFATLIFKGLHMEY